MKEISTKISYQKNKPSAKFIRSGKCFFFFYKQHFYKQRQIEISNPSSWKKWLQGISRYGIKGAADKFYVDISLVCGFHFNLSDINISFGKSKKIFENQHCSK